ncbi:MAG TPA: carboxylesterase family protein [Acidimicrobiia bacterium]
MDARYDMLETTAGTVRGRISSDGVRTFLGVPYGASTANAGRFAAPRAVEPWGGVRDALDHGPSSWQMGPADEAQARVRTDMLQVWGGINEPSMSEDCLVLNVWAPAEVRAPLPVLVYLHGGGHSVGSGSWPAYDGHRLAARGDVVVVTVNHRLGVLAYCYLAELMGADFATSGVNGILDIVESLRWVRDNIAGVDGDPGRVLVAGQSGGGGKVGALLAVPSAEGLFHTACIMSAGNPTLQSPADATQAASRLLDHLGIAARDAEQLLAVAPERLVEAQQAIGGPLGPFAPVLDGTWAVAQPADAVASGRAPDVPILIGTTRDEQASFVAMMPIPDDADDAWVVERARLTLGDDAERVVAAYRAARPLASARELHIALATDAGARMGSIRFAEAKAAAGGAPVWMYRFDWETPAEGYAGTAPHGVDTTFFFDQLDAATVTADGPHALAAHASSALVSFAATGSPEYDGGPAWPPYDLDRRATMLFDTESRAVDDPDHDARELLAPLSPVPAFSLFAQRR